MPPNPTPCPHATGHQRQHIKTETSTVCQTVTCKSEKRVKNEDAGTLINKNVISPPPNTPHPTPPPPHAVPPPRTNPGMPTRNYHRKRVTKHSKKRGKFNGAQENSVERGMKWMLRKWRKHEKTTTLRDALAGCLPWTTTCSESWWPQEFLAFLARTSNLAAIWDWTSLISATFEGTLGVFR